MGGRKAVREGFLEEVVCELPLEEGTTGRVAWRFAFTSGVYGMDWQGLGGASWEDSGTWCSD